MLLFVLLASGPLAGCSLPPNRAIEPAFGDPEAYRSMAQPVVQKHCAFLACHGRTDLPLFVYAVDFARAAPGGAGTPIDVLNLSSEELLHNQQALAARVDNADPDRTSLLRKVRPPAEGGEVHFVPGSEVIFSRRSDPDYQALCRWVETVSAEIPGKGPIRGCEP